jgi:hypothetical protein
MFHLNFSFYISYIRFALIIYLPQLQTLYSINAKEIPHLLVYCIFKKKTNEFDVWTKWFWLNSSFLLMQKCRDIQRPIFDEYLALLS